MNIYLGNIEIAGYFMRLKQGFDSIGVKADLWYLIDNKYYNAPTNLLLKINQNLFQFFRANQRTFLLPLTWLAALAMGIIHTLVFCYALLKYDVFILNSQPFFNFSELAILRFFRKKIIVVFLGSESRPAFVAGNHIQGKFSDGEGYHLDYCYKTAKAQLKMIRRIEKYAHHIINHPPTALFHSRPFIAWLHIGFPNNLQSTEVQYAPAIDSKIRVLHAPSNSVSKGSKKIMETIQKLQDEGLPIEFQKLENVPNEKVIYELAKCDFVVDELYSDIPIGGLGTEAAFARKPVINGGYYASHIKTDYPDGVIPPACFCLPGEVEDNIRELATNPQKRQASASALHNFVIDNWDCAAIAAKFMKIINNEIPKAWIYDPVNIDFFHGYGIGEQKLREFLSLYVEKFGAAALLLDDKPALKKRILDFIQNPTTQK